LIAESWGQRGISGTEFKMSSQAADASLWGKLPTPVAMHLGLKVICSSFYELNIIILSNFLVSMKRLYEKDFNKEIWEISGHNTEFAVKTHSALKGLI
jgi:hypothetical protein